MMPSESGSSGTEKRSRLPVNPRRHKVAPEQRKRVATACNSCNVRRIKCSGDRPCQQCASSSRECVYPQTVDKVSIPRSELDALRRRVDAYERAAQEGLVDPARVQDLLQQQLQLASTSPSSAAASPSQAFWADASVASLDSVAAFDDDPAGAALPPLEGRLLRDEDGTARFLGETSAAAFLDHVNEFMASVAASPLFRPQQALVASTGTYHTRDSRALRSVDVNPLWLPPSPNLSTMLTELRNIIQDGNGDWPSGGIYWWADLSTLPVVPPRTESSSPSEFRHLALFHAALAVLYYRSTGSRQQQQQQQQPRTEAAASPSEGFFARAQSLLGDNPLEISQGARIEDVATLSLLALYLVQTDRRDAAAMYLATAVRVGVMLGAHRTWPDERGKRIFWTAYVLDRWVSCALGRPAAIADDAIHLPLPEDAPSMPPAAGLKAHVELARISGHIVTHASSISPDTLRHVERTTYMLEQWQASLPASLTLSSDGTSDDPAVSLLHMQHNHLVMLAARPVFLAGVKRTFAERLSAHASSPPSPHPHVRHLQSCASAAQRTLALARHASTLDARRRGSGPTSSPSILLHGGLQHIADAATCLLLRELVTPSGTPDAQLPSQNGDVDFALGRFQDEGTDFARACGAGLARLRGLVTGLRGRMADVGDGQVYGDLLALMGDEWAMQEAYRFDDMAFTGMEQ